MVSVICSCCVGVSCMLVNHARLPSHASIDILGQVMFWSWTNMSRTCMSFLQDTDMLTLTCPERTWLQHVCSSLPLAIHQCHEPWHNIRLSHEPWKWIHKSHDSSWETRWHQSTPNPPVVRRSWDRRQQAVLSLWRVVSWLYLQLWNLKHDQVHHLAKCGIRHYSMFGNSKTLCHCCVWRTLASTAIHWILPCICSSLTTTNFTVGGSDLLVLRSETDGQRSVRDCSAGSWNQNSLEKNLQAAI